MPIQLTRQKNVLILILFLSVSLLSGCLPASYSLTTEELAKQWWNQGAEATMRKYSGKTVELSGVVAGKAPAPVPAVRPLCCFTRIPRRNC